MELISTYLVRQSDGGADGGGGSGEEAAAAASGLTLGDWLLAGGIVVAGIVLAMIAANVVRKLVARRNEMVATLVSRVVASVIFIIGLVVGLTTVGVPLAPLAGGLSIVGLAVAFALKSILNNLLSGIMIQIRQPFQIGHLVKNLVKAEPGRQKVEDIDYGNPHPPNAGAPSALLWIDRNSLITCVH